MGSTGLYGSFDSDLQDCCSQGLHAHGEPLLTHTSPGDPPTPAGRSGSVSCGVITPFPWVLVHTRFCLRPPRVKSLFPPGLSSNPTGLHSLSPWGFPVPLPDPQAGKPDGGIQNLHKQWENFFDIIVQVRDLILLCLHPSYQLVRRRQWHPTPVLLPGKSHGRRSLVGCRWGC